MVRSYTDSLKYLMTEALPSAALLLISLIIMFIILVASTLIIRSLFKLFSKCGGGRPIGDIIEMFIQFLLIISFGYMLLYMYEFSYASIAILSIVLFVLQPFYSGTLKEYISGIMLRFSYSFRYYKIYTELYSDNINIKGKIKEIKTFYTVIKSDEKTFHIPNSIFINKARIINDSYTDERNKEMQRIMTASDDY